MKTPTRMRIPSSMLAASTSSGHAVTATSASCFDRGNSVGSAILLYRDELHLIRSGRPPAMPEAAGVVQAFAGRQVVQLALDVELDPALHHVDELVAGVAEVLVELGRRARELQRQHRALATDERASRAAGRLDTGDARLHADEAYRL